MATGTHLALLDVDDVWLPGRGAGLADAASARPDLDIIRTDAYITRSGVREERTCYGTRHWPDCDRVLAILTGNFIFGAAGHVATARRLLRPLRAQARVALDRLDPARLAIRSAPPAVGVTFACIYREGNAAAVSALLQGLPPDGTVRLWALDQVAPELALHTVGAGPGSRFELLNRLVHTTSPHDRRDALVLCDDDVRFVVGGVADLVAIGRSLGLDLFQPAHSRHSFISLSTEHLVRRHRLLVARRTTFVEQGPLLVLSAPAQRELLPLPEDMGMGWGIEVRWSTVAAAQHLQLGIVDATPVRHLAPPAAGYDTARELMRLERELELAGVQRLDDLQRVVERITLLDALSGSSQRPSLGGR